MLADDFDAAGGVCPVCDRLAIGTSRCSACGQAIESVPDLREAVFDQARDQRARVEHVSGPAATRLAEAGGIGAWTRF